MCMSHRVLKQDSSIWQVKIRFDAAEALSELDRLGLVSKEGKGYKLCSTKRAIDVLKDHWEDLLLDAKHAAVVRG